MTELWQRVYRVLDTSHKEYAKWDRSCREQGDLLRALEDLAAQERTMYELDNRKVRLMTVFKLALTNLVMWVRDQVFPPTYTHATWGRLLPFFHLPGVVTSSPSACNYILFTTDNTPVTCCCCANASTRSTFICLMVVSFCSR